MSKEKLLAIIDSLTNDQVEALQRLLGTPSAPPLEPEWVDGRVGEYPERIDLVGADDLDAPSAYSPIVLTFVAGLGAVIHGTASQKGWHDKQRGLPEQIALMHSELSEALEAYRTDAESTKIPGFSGVAEEMADTVIRILDTCHHHKIPLGEAMMAKMAYNLTRPHRHGGKKC